MVQPNMRQPRSWPGARNVLRIVRVRALAGLMPNDWRIHIPVARFYSQNFRYFALLDVEALGHFSPDRRAFGRVFANVRMVSRAPTQTAPHRCAGGFHIAQSDWAALFIIGSEHMRSAPPCER